VQVLRPYFFIGFLVMYLGYDGEPSYTDIKLWRAFSVIFGLIGAITAY